MKRAVTEEDFRRPEFRGEKPEDYEFRDDGKIVRKDRWQTGIFSIAYATGFNSRNGFEIGDVVDKVRKLANDQDEIDNEIGDFMWAELFHPDICPVCGELKVKCGCCPTDDGPGQPGAAVEIEKKGTEDANAK